MQSLCNACGIRQRKARRAMAAAAAAANGTILAADATTMKSSTKVQRKEKKPKNGNGVVPQFKKRCKLTASPSRGRKKICFEDLAISISKNSAFQRVFPQDEKDAAILLMALSYGLVHGWERQRYCLSSTVLLWSDLSSKEWFSISVFLYVV